MNDKNKQRDFNRLKMAVPVAALSALGALALHGHDADPTPAEIAPIGSVSSSVTIGGAETGYVQGAAVAAVEKDLDAIADGLDSGSVSNQDLADEIRNLPTYEIANEAQELAAQKSQNLVADSGDKFKAEVEVSTDAEGNPIAEVVDASIKDLPNNHE